MKNLFKENLVFLKEKNNETYASIALQAGVSPNTVSNWVDQRSEPKISEVHKISQYFEIAIHDLLFTDLRHVNLNNFNEAGKNWKNVNLNVYRNVNLNGDSSPSEVNERRVEYPSGKAVTATKKVYNLEETMATALRALETANVVLERENAFLREENTRLKEEMAELIKNEKSVGLGTGN